MLEAQNLVVLTSGDLAAEGVGVRLSRIHTFSSLRLVSPDPNGVSSNLLHNVYLRLFILSCFILLK